MGIIQIFLLVLGIIGCVYVAECDIPFHERVQVFLVGWGIYAGIIGLSYGL